MGGENRRASTLPGEGVDHFHCTVEPSPGHIRCRKVAFGVSRITIAIGHLMRVKSRPTKSFWAPKTRHRALVGIGGGCGGVKQGRFVILRFPLFCSV